jgi:phospholipid N-methyltransferase
MFVQFGYTWTSWAGPARALREELGTCFAEVTTSPVVWRNLPPAVVHRAARPRR